MDKKILNDTEREGLLRATDYVLELFESYIRHDVIHDEIDWDEYFKQGEPITLDQLRYFFEDRAEWFFNGDEFPNETAEDTWGVDQESVPLYQHFIGEVER